MWKKTIVITGAVMGVAAVTGAAWAVLDYTGVRPVVKTEFVAHKQDFQQVARNLAWIMLDNFERKLAKAGLTRQECARYRKLAMSLGVQPKRC